MPDPREKTGLEVAQQTIIRQRLRAVIDRILEQHPEILEQDPDAGAAELARLAPEYLRQEAGASEEVMEAYIGLIGAEVAREKGFVPDDPNRGDLWIRAPDARRADDV